MNRRRRERLKEALRSIEAIAAILQGVCDSEENALENYPENLQGTEKFEKMEEAVEHLNEAIDRLDATKEEISAAMA